MPRGPKGDGQTRRVSSVTHRAPGLLFPIEVRPDIGAPLAPILTGKPRFGTGQPGRPAIRQITLASRGNRASRLVLNSAAVDAARRYHLQLPSSLGLSPVCAMANRRVGRPPASSSSNISNFIEPPFERRSSHFYSHGQQDRDGKTNDPLVMCFEIVHGSVRSAGRPMSLIMVKENQAAASIIFVRPSFPPKVQDRAESSHR